jgi:NAD+ kinase
LVAQTLPWVQVERLAAEIHFVRHGGTQRTEPVLNDFLYTHLNPAATTRYRLQWGDQKEDQLSSGIWMSTGVGSTAAIRTAGGEATSLQDSRFQFYVRELYSPPSRPCMLQTAFFTPEAASFSIENYSERAILAFDGQHGKVDLRYGDRVRFLRGPRLTLAMPDT